MKTCELRLYSQKPTGNGKNKVYPVCGKPAAFTWTPRKSPDRHMLVCTEHAEIAGNFTDELKPI